MCIFNTTRDPIHLIESSLFVLWSSNHTSGSTLLIRVVESVLILLHKLLVLIWIVAILLLLVIAIPWALVHPILVRVKLLLGHHHATPTARLHSGVEIPHVVALLLVLHLLRLERLLLALHRHTKLHAKLRVLLHHLVLLVRVLLHHHAVVEKLAVGLIELVLAKVHSVAVHVVLILGVHSLETNLQWLGAVLHHFTVPVANQILALARVVAVDESVELLFVKVDLFEAVWEFEEKLVDKVVLRGLWGEAVDPDDGWHVEPLLVLLA